ncbi:MAG: tRNA nucleotidyltransferase [Clostridiales bacterium]|nr:tRNA nucleotidyltransferase [Clostridiales bacterium]
MTYEETVSMARRLAEKVKNAGGRAYYVGGYVRSRLLHADSKDVDVEVHGLFPSQLESILDTLGQRLEMGKSFGVYGLKGYELDIAMPRRETATGRGHRDFAIDVDPFIGTEKAAMRRDFTVNAILEDVLTGQIIDHFGGVADLEKGILRHVDDHSFPEDPLRVLRAAQFSARLSFTIAEETLQLCSGIDIAALPRERVMEEMKKGLLKAECPSVFFEALRKMGQLEVWLPEVKALIGIEQNPVYHAEGDVWDHTMMVLDVAASYRSQARNPLGLMLSALCHDFGKVSCTQVIDGVIRSFGHETAGRAVAEKFLQRLTGENLLLKYVPNMVELHMRPGALFRQNSSTKATNRLFDLAVEPDDLILLSLADMGGKLPREEPKDAAVFLRQRLETYRDYMSRPGVTGQDLIAAGMKPDKTFSDLLAYAHNLQLAGVDKSTALVQTLAYAKEKNKRSAPHG